MSFAYSNHWSNTSLCLIKESLGQCVHKIVKNHNIIESIYLNISIIQSMQQHVSLQNGIAYTSCVISLFFIILLFIENNSLQTQIQAQQRDIDQLKNNLAYMCCICYNQVSNILINPCKHMCVCEDCFVTLFFNHIFNNAQFCCPICRSLIKDVCNVYG